MSNPQPPKAALGGTADEIETRFYDALQQGDLAALMTLWADDDEVVCVHPGGARMIGMQAIRAGFETIFGNGPVPVRPEQVHRVEALSCSVHHLVERIDVRTGDGLRTAWMLVTNVYVKTAFGWRIVAHHASPAVLKEPAADDAPSTLH